MCIPDRENAVLVINGDTFVDFSLSEMYQTLTASNADLAMTLVDCEDTSRYGRVTTDENRSYALKRNNKAVLDLSMLVYTS